MLGDLRVLDTGDELWLDTERVGAAGAVRHDPAPRRGRLRRRAAQAHAGARRCCRSSARAPREAVGGEVGPTSTPTAPRQLGGADVLLVATDLGVDVVCAAEDADACARRALGVARRCPRRPPRSCASSRGRPRYGVDLDDARHPPGGRPQRARGRASRRAATSARRRSRACTTAASPTATCAGCACRSRSRPATPLRARRARGRPARHRASSPRARARSGWRSCAARRARATSSPRATRARSWPSCRSDRSRLRRFVALKASPRERVPPPAAALARWRSEPRRLSGLSGYGRQKRQASGRGALLPRAARIVASRWRSDRRRSPSLGAAVSAAHRCKRTRQSARAA